MKNEDDLTLSPKVEEFLTQKRNTTFNKTPWSKNKHFLSDGIIYAVAICAMLYTYVGWDIFKYYIYLGNFCSIIILFATFIIYWKLTTAPKTKGSDTIKLVLIVSFANAYWTLFFKTGRKFTQTLYKIYLALGITCITLFVTGFYFSGILALIYGTFQILLIRFQFKSALYVDKNIDELLGKVEEPNKPVASFLPKDGS